MNVSAATQERLVVLDELQHGRRSHTLAIAQDIHAQCRGRVVNHPNASFHLAIGQLSFEAVKFFANGWLAGEMAREVVQRHVFPSFIQRHTLAAELLRASQIVSVRHAPMFISKRIITNFVHAAEDQSFFAVNPPVQIDAQTRFPFSGAAPEHGGRRCRISQRRYRTTNAASGVVPMQKLVALGVRLPWGEDRPR